MNKSFFSFNFSFSILLGTATLSALVFSQPPVFAAKTSTQIGEIAQKVTVQVNTDLEKGGVGSGGSGVIIDQNGNTYTVLTCIHVIGHALKNKPNPSVRTWDGKSYPLTNIKRLGSYREVDLAIGTFNASGSQAYESATLTDSNQVKSGSKIYVYGYPVKDAKIAEARDYWFVTGTVTDRLAKGVPNREAYTMLYNAPTLGGMSGGPVFDVDGRVVGIHGRGDEEELATKIMLKDGINGAVPINVFSERVSQIGSTALEATVDKTPSTDNPTERLNNPQSAEDYLAKGAVQDKQGTDSQAIDSYTEAIKRDPNLADAYYRRANVRFGQGDKQGALEDYNQALRLNPEYANAYYNRGVILYEQRDKQRALENFDQYISRFPGDAAAYFIRGSLRRDIGDTQGTLEDFDQVVAIRPDEPRAYYNRGIVRSEEQDWQGAVEDLQKAIDLFQQQGLQEEDDKRFYQKAQELIQSMQGAGGATTIEQPEPEDNSAQPNPDEFDNQQPELSGDSIQPTSNDSENQPANPVDNGGW